MRLKIIDVSLKNVAISHPDPLQMIDLNTSRTWQMCAVFQRKILQVSGALFGALTV